MPTQAQCEARWKAAVQGANRINGFIDKGYLVLRAGSRDRVRRLTISPTEIVERDGNCVYQWFEYNLNYDHGIYDTVKTIKSRFRNIEIFKPVARRKRNV